MSLEQDVFVAARYAGAAVPEKPKLAPWVTSIDLGDGRIQFRGTFLRLTLQNELFAGAFKAVEGQLDGANTADALNAGADVDPTILDFVLRLMAANGLLLPGDNLPTRPSERLRFFAQISSAQAISGLSSIETRPVWLVADDAVAKRITPLLKEAGVVRIRHVSIDDADPIKRLDELPDKEGSAPDLMIVVTKDWANDILYEINEYCLNKGIRWITATLNGPSARLGPTFVPRQTACYTCLKTRLTSNSGDPEADRVFDEKMKGNTSPDQGQLGAFTSVISGQLVLEAIRLLSGISEPTTIGRFVQFTALSADNKSHKIWRVPRCKACGRNALFRQLWDVGNLQT